MSKTTTAKTPFVRRLFQRFITNNRNGLLVYRGRKKGMTLADGDYSHVDKVYRDCPTVSTCVNMVALGIAQLSVEGRGAGWITRNTNGYDAYGFLYTLVVDLMKYGFCLVKKTTNILGQKALEIQRFGTYDLEVDEGGNVAPYQNGARLNAMDWVLVRDQFDQSEPLTSRVKQIVPVAYLLIASDIHSQREYEGGSGNVLLYKVPTAKLPPKEKEQLAEQIEDALKTEPGEKAFIVVDQGGDLELRETGKVSTENQIKLRESNKLEIAAKFGTPPFSIGGSAETKYNNATAAASRYYRDTMIPLAINIASTLSRGVGMELKLNIMDLIKGDLPAQIDLAGKAIKMMVMTPNEARAQFLDLGEVEDGDKLITSGKYNSQDSPDGRRGETDTDDGNVAGDVPDE